MQYFNREGHNIKAFHNASDTKIMSSFFQENKFLVNVVAQENMMRMLLPNIVLQN